MDNSALWMFFLVTAMVGYHYITTLSAKIKSDQESLSLMRVELNELREKVAELIDDIERITFTPTDMEAKDFDRLPALTSDRFVSLSAGDKLCLVLKGFGVFYPVEYLHHELAYRTPGQKDAIAHGKARLDTSDEFRDVRIFFSRPLATAALRGLDSWLDGHVKEEQSCPIG